MEQPPRPAVEDELYAGLAQAQAALQSALMDPRYGEDPEFTNKTNDLKHFAATLRQRLRNDAGQLLVNNNRELKQLLDEMGIHVDQMHDAREAGQIAETIGSTIERAVKIVHPFF